MPTEATLFYGDIEDSDDYDLQSCGEWSGHSWVCEDCDSGEGRCYCEFCGADGDA